jgi:hypothetical protein
MAIDADSLTEVLLLAQLCEDVARAALNVAQGQLRAKTIAQEVFDQAFQDYGLAMQKARDLYYQTSHGLARQITSSAELKTLTRETTELKKALASLTKVEHVLSISFGVVTLVAAVATTVTAPSSAALQEALAAARTLKQAIG